MIEDTSTNIEIRLNIPAVKYMAAAQEIMSQYGEVVKTAMEEVKSDLMFNEAFQNEIKNAIKSRLNDAVQKAIKSAAERVVWDTFMNKSASSNIEKVISDSIIDALTENKEGECAEFKCEMNRINDVDYD